MSACPTPLSIRYCGCSIWDGAPEDAPVEIHSVEFVGKWGISPSFEWFYFSIFVARLGKPSMKPLPFWNWSIRPYPDIYDASHTTNQFIIEQLSNRGHMLFRCQKSWTFLHCVLIGQCLLSIAQNKCSARHSHTTSTTYTVPRHPSPSPRPRIVAPENNI